MSHYRAQSLPIMQKAREIAQITRTIVESIPPENDWMDQRDQMLLNAYTLGAKIAAAEGGDMYHLRMECAILVKLAARELLTQTSWFREEKSCPVEYLVLLRQEIEQFRLLFLDWVDSFDRTNDIEDEWGHFFR